MIKKRITPLFYEAMLIILIILTPLFYGSLNPSALAIEQTIIYALFILFLLQLAVSAQSKIIYSEPIRIWLVFITLACFQLIPLPVFLIKIISPQTVFLKQDYLPLQNQIKFLSLTFYNLTTKREIINLVSFFMVFLLTLNTVKTRRQFERLFLVIIIWGVILSFYGVIRKYFILNIEVSGSFGSFGNRNHFAGYMVMIVPLTVGYALYCRERSKKLIFSFLAVMLSVSIFLSLSRAGSISLVFALLLMAVLLRKELNIRNKLWLIPTAVVFGLILILIPGLNPIKQRFVFFGDGLIDRWQIVRDSLPIVRDFPLFGVGLGNFSYIFTKYRQLASPNYYNYLHNDHLQLIVEMGLLGASVYFYFLYKIFRDIITKLRQRHDVFAKYMVLGGVCGLFGVLLQSFFEFNFHIPAVAILFWLLLGAVYGCVHTHFYSKNGDQDK